MHRKRWITGFSLVVVMMAGSTCVVSIALVHLVRYGRHVSAADLPGAYRANYIDSTETLILQADGIFHETYTYRDGASFQNTGQWRTETHDGRVDVLFDNAIIFRIGSIGEPPKHAWRLHAYRGLRGGITLKLGDPDDFVQLHKSD